MPANNRPCLVRYDQEEEDRAAADRAPPQASVWAKRAQLKEDEALARRLQQVRLTHVIGSFPLIRVWRGCQKSVVGRAREGLRMVRSLQHQGGCDAPIRALVRSQDPVVGTGYLLLLPLILTLDLTHWFCCSHIPARTGARAGPLRGANRRNSISSAGNTTQLTAVGQCAIVSALRPPATADQPKPWWRQRTWCDPHYPGSHDLV